ncbi:MAG: hypothetical protein RIS64_3724 [Bacteroidota bacterium]|jgi:sterol desaturase/sphingolipid hydroxylase (fatty acid hydroxylase superfamily)
MLQNQLVEQELLKLSIPFYAIVILAEILISNAQGKQWYSVKDTLYNVYLTLLNAGLDFLMRIVFVGSFMTWVYQYRLLEIQNPIYYWLTLLILEDFLFYWLHRMEHYSRFFWAVHVTHHSSDYFNLTTGFRSSVLQPLYRFLFFIPLCLLGFKMLDIALMFAMTQTYGIIVHTKYINRIPIWEWIFVTPSHHRVHHASNVRYLDKNMGMMFIIWDRMFGTFAEELETEPVKYGLHGKKGNKSLIQVIFDEWKSLWKVFFVTRKNLPLSIRLKYLFKAPGWSHDRSTKTAAQFRKEIGLK